MFNKKYKNRIKELETKLKDTKQELESYKLLYKQETKNNSSLEKINNALISENEKQVEWIKNILKHVNTTNYDKTQEYVITIPMQITKREPSPFIEDDKFIRCEEKVTYIPPIRFVEKIIM